MTRFCTDTISPGEHLRPQGGILRAGAMALSADGQHAAQLQMRRATADAAALLERTRTQAADELAATRAQAEAELANARNQAETELAAARAQADEELEAARAEAERVLTEAQEEAQRMTADEQQRVMEQAAALLGGLEEASGAILERVDGIVIELARKLFDRLIMDTTPRERLEAALKYVVLEAPPKLVDPLLRVHPEDVELLPEVDWPVKGDPNIARGACRLEAASGQWCAGFDAAVEALRAAFNQGVDESEREILAAAEAEQSLEQEEDAADAYDAEQDSGHDLEHSSEDGEQADGY